MFVKIKKLFKNDFGKLLCAKVHCRWLQPTEYEEKCFGFSQIAAPTNRQII
jgi:hypothetical protein